MPTPTGTHIYRIMYVLGDSPTAKDVKAAYLQHEDGMIVFKDVLHAVVFAVAAHAFLSAERLPSGNIAPGRRDL